MIRIAHMFILAAFLAVGFAAPSVFANEPAPAEQKEKKDTGTKLYADEEKKGETKDAGGKADEGKKDEKKGMGGK